MQNEKVLTPNHLESDFKKNLIKSSIKKYLKKDFQVNNKGRFNKKK